MTDTAAPAAPAHTATPAGGGRDRRMLVLFLVIFINMLGFGIVLPVFPFFGLLVDATPSQITLAIAAYSLGQLIGAPLWGRLSDRFGRRPVLVISLIGAIFSYVVLALATDIVTLGASRLFGGLMAGNIATAFAYVTDITKAEERPKAMGLLGAAFGLGFIFGPAIGGLLVGNDPGVDAFMVIGVVAALISAVALLLTIFVLPESRTSADRAAGREAGPAVTTAALLKAKPAVAVLMVVTLLAITAAALMEASFALFAHGELGWGPSDVGLSFGLLGIVSVGLQAGAAGRLARRFSSRQIVTAGLAIQGAGFIALSQSSSTLWVILSVMIIATGFGVFNPALQTLTAAQTGPHDRGMVLGLTQGASSLGRVIGPATAGLMYQTLGPSSPFLAGAAIIVFALMAALAIQILRRSSQSIANQRTGI
jgi:MFS transporter, DHA1 family, tetracycline resistance protein